MPGLHRQAPSDRRTARSDPQCTVCPYRDFVEEEVEPINDCSLCSKPLAEAATVRLPCYHVFHTACLISAWDDLVETITCPRCAAPVFATQDVPQPIRDGLVEAFQGKSFLQPFVGAAAPVVTEQMDATTQALLGIEQEPDVHYTVQEVKHISKETPPIAEPPVVDFLDDVFEDDSKDRKRTTAETLCPAPSRAAR